MTEQENIIEGYVVKNYEGTYLTKDLDWYHDEPERAYVFSESEVLTLILEAVRNNWEFKPGFVARALFDVQQSVTKITGNDEPLR